MDITSIVCSIFWPIAAGVLSVIAWETARWLVNSVWYYCRYNKYEGEYLAYFKYIDEKDYDKSWPMKIIKLKYKGRKFIISAAANSKPITFNISGQIRMDGDYGRGYYQHDHENGKRARFGFMEVQLADPYILVHEIIFDGTKDNEGRHHSRMNTDGYRWVKRAVE